MRDAKVLDGWRRVSNRSKYTLKLDSVILRNLKGFEDEVSINFNSGLSAICGKNGVGKSTLLRLIYEKLKYNKLTSHKFTADSLVETVIINEKKIDISDRVFYLDPSFECSRIINFLTNTSNFDELLEGVEPNFVLNKVDNLKVVSKAIGKQYKEIKIYELESAIEDDTTFPYFDVTLPDGTRYQSEHMGMGEHLCMYIFWFSNWLEKNSILLIEEIENYLSAYSQKTLIDYLAYVLSDRRIWTILTSHSEHILSKIGARNTNILHTRNGKSRCVNSSKSREYLRALGLGEKIIGAYLVEDQCAALFLKYIINLLEPSLLDVREIIGLRCDSNLEKLALHFQPHVKLEYDFFVVFDADQSNKVFTLSPEYIPVTALPSKDLLNPEEELWQTINEQSLEVCRRLGCKPERLADSIDQHGYADHHDRFFLIAKDLKTTYESLVAVIVSVWLQDPTNLYKSKLLIVALKHRNNYASSEEVIKYFNQLYVDSDILTEKLSIIMEEKIRFRFNGVEHDILLS